MKYTVQTLPKDMQMKLTKDKDWFAQYSWFEYLSSQDLIGEKENSSSLNNPDVSTKSVKKPTAAIRKSTVAGTKKGVTFDKKTTT
jgi:hypothetical protein